MKVKRGYACDRLFFGVIGGLAFASGCVVAPENPPPPVVVASPTVVASQPVVMETVAVPSYYVIADGEYVGWVGSRYYYLSSGGIWLACDSVRLERFHLWERSHRDWRRTAIPNTRFRRDAQGREYSAPRVPHVQSGRPIPQGQRESRYVPRVQPQQTGRPQVQPQQVVKPHVQPQQVGKPYVQPKSNQSDVRAQSGKPGMQPQPQSVKMGAQPKQAVTPAQSSRKDASVQPKRTSATAAGDPKNTAKRDGR